MNIYEGELKLIVDNSEHGTECIVKNVVESTRSADLTSAGAWPGTACFAICQMRF